jgi:UDP-glucose 4-epimerase
MKRILVTGGLGFIGSHTVVALQNQGYEVVIIDNLSNATSAVLEGIKMITGVLPYFEKIDLRDKVALSSFLQSNTDIDGIIHFAASKAVGESVLQPLHYYENNINALVNLLLEVSQLNKPIEFIFSSSCTVYGQADIMPIKEDSPIKIPASPYGNTKQIGEEILKDLSIVNENIHIILLRYFNPIGAHPSLEIGELPLGKPQNLVPFITQTAAGLHDKLTVFGDDYPTLDGTCVRDYIDVVDLATAHVAALNRLLKNQNDSNFEMYNLGSGKGSSVLEVIKSFEKVAEISLNYEIGSRRSGDVISAFADTSLANQKLGWKTKVSLDESVLNAWKWEKKIRGIK